MIPWRYLQACINKVIYNHINQNTWDLSLNLYIQYFFSKLLSVLTYCSVDATYLTISISLAPTIFFLLGLHYYNLFDKTQILHYPQFRSKHAISFYKTPVSSTHDTMTYLRKNSADWKHIPWGLCKSFTMMKQIVMLSKHTSFMRHKRLVVLLSVMDTHTRIVAYICTFCIFYVRKFYNTHIHFNLAR